MLVIIYFSPDYDPSEGSIKLCPSRFLVLVTAYLWFLIAIICAETCAKASGDVTSAHTIKKSFSREHYQKIKSLK